MTRHILIFLIIFYPFCVAGQSLSTIPGIDSALNQKFTDSSNVKNYPSLIGNIKIYKRIAGIKFRIDKGEDYSVITWHKDSILQYCYIRILKRSYGNDFVEENFYYLQNEFIKYESSTTKRTKKGNSIKNQQAIYFNSGKQIAAIPYKSLQPNYIMSIKKQAVIHFNESVDLLTSQKPDL